MISLQRLGSHSSLPDLLDGIRVESEGKRRPLSEFATVTVKDGKNLVVTVYEESVRSCFLQLSSRKVLICSTYV